MLSVGLKFQPMMGKADMSSFFCSSHLMPFELKHHNPTKHWLERVFFVNGSSYIIMHSQTTIDKLVSKCVYELQKNRSHSSRQNALAGAQSRILWQNLCDKKFSFFF